MKIYLAVLLLATAGWAADAPKLTEAQKEALQRSYQRAVILQVQSANADKQTADAIAAYQTLMEKTAKESGFPKGTRFQPNLTSEPVEVVVVPPAPEPKAEAKKPEPEKK